MSIKIICDLCKKELKSNNAMLYLNIARFSGRQNSIFPLFESQVKRDVCDECFDKIFGK